MSTPAPPRARRHLLSWVRDGLGDRIAEADPGTGAVPARATLSSALTLNGQPVPGPSLVLHGPGDVTALDPRQVVRTDPAPGATAFEASHLALVEFDDPGLPWRLTPLRPSAQKLRPWLVLVVLDTGVPGVALRTDPQRSVPVLECPGSELPDLAQSASWAHAEITAAEGEDIAQLLTGRPERSVSRLIAPRRLADDRGYLACLVPAFEHGRLAGLGEDPPNTPTTDPAWTGDEPSVRLPVYHHWTFGTGPGGDFPALAQRLRPAVLGPGWLELSFKEADPELTEALGDDTGIAGMLPALTQPGLEQGLDVHPGYAHAMATILGRGATTVTPPKYLAAHTGHAPVWNFTEPLWMRQLNLDPRLRAAAGLGAEVVRLHQEALMAAAWRQASALERANRELQRGRLGRAVSESLHRRHFTPPPAGARLAVAAEQVDVVVQRAATALRRIPTPEGTVATDLATHEPTATTASAEVQRAARPTGPAARAGGATTSDPLPPAVTPVATGALVPAPPVPAASDAGVLDRYTGDRPGYGFRDITATRVASATPWWRNPTPLTQPLVPPGPVGYLTDLLVVREALPAPPASPPPPPPAATETPLRFLDFDGRAQQTGTPLPVAGDPARSGVRVAGGLMARGQASRPTALLAGFQQHSWYDEWNQRWHHVWEAFVRWMPFGADGLPQPGPYRQLHPNTVGIVGGIDVLLRRRPGQTDQAAELVLVYAEGWDLFARSHRLDTLEQLGPPRELPAFVYEPTSIAADMVPVPVVAGQPYAEPRDAVFAYVHQSGYYDGQRSWFTWALTWYLARNFGTPEETWSERRTRDLAPRVYGEGQRADLSLGLTDLDGDGEPEMVVHLTFDEQRASGEPLRRVTRQIVGHGLRPDGTVEEWDAGRTLAIAPSHEGSTVCILGELDNQRQGRLVGLGDAFQAAAARHQGVLIRPATEGATANPASYDVGDVAAGVSGGLDPAATIPAAVGDRVSLPGATSAAGLSGLSSESGDPLRDRVYEPAFPQPMSEPLRELFPELVFPGVDALPDDSVALLGGNSELIAAYLAGLNHEFGRELLWRGYPSSGRATWFRRFFDARSADPASPAADILEIAEWGEEGDLGDKTTGAASSDSVILVVRGELLRRYPDVSVQAARAIVTSAGREPAAELLLPAFTGRAGAGASLFSFPIPEAEVRGGEGDPGWFFIFAEPPTEPRFAATSDPAWTAPGAHAAAALLRMPFRVAIHASDLLPA